MGKPYSQDLRERVIAAVDTGTGAYVAAPLFRVTNANYRLQAGGLDQRKSKNYPCIVYGSTPELINPAVQSTQIAPTLPACLQAIPSPCRGTKATSTPFLTCGSPRSRTAPRATTNLR